MAVKILSLLILVTPSLAHLGGPSNLPPLSFKGQQVVDSRGWLFLRAATASAPPMIALAAPVKTTLPGSAQCYPDAPKLERVKIAGGTALVCTEGNGLTSDWWPPSFSSTSQVQMAAVTAPLMVGTGRGRQSAAKRFRRSVCHRLCCGLGSGKYAARGLCRRLSAPGWWQPNSRKCPEG